MPNVIKRYVGLEFGSDELQYAYPELDSLAIGSEEYFQTAAALLEKAHQDEEFEQYGFSSDCEITEILMDGDVIFVEFY